MTETRIYSAKNIVTMNTYRATASHVAVRDGRILGVGDLAELETWGEHVLDDRYEDKVLLPGFVEGHGHMLEATMWAGHYAGFFPRIDPFGNRHSGLRSIDDVVDMLKRKDGEMADPDQPLGAWCFDPIYYGGRRMTREDLDKVSTTRPVLVMHASLHITNVNQAYIDRIGWQDKDDVVGIKRHADSSISGEMHGAANQYTMTWIMRANAKKTADGFRAEWDQYGAIATRAGVTTLTDLGASLSEKGIAAIAEWSREEDAPIRLVPALLATAIPTEEGLARLKAVEGMGTDKLKLGIVKLVVDGSIQGFTGRMRWPGYANGAENGVWNIEPGEVARRLGAYHDAGYQVHIHTNGDEATQVTLDAVEEVLGKNPRADHRHTLQHCQMADEAQFGRIKELGLCVNLFSNHLYYWGDQHRTQTMGPDRAMRMNATGTAERLGVPFAIHSDTPITPLDPLFTAWCAVNRLTESSHVLGPNECISVMSALRAITLGAAWTLKMDGEIGSIEAGKRADFAVLDEDPLEVNPVELKDIHVSGTMIGGHAVKSS
jgi:hypothetical protein